MNSVITSPDLKNDTVLSLLEGGTMSLGVTGPMALNTNLFEVDMNFESEDLSQAYASFTYWMRPVVAAAVLMFLTITAVLMTGPIVHP